MNDADRKIEELAKAVLDQKLADIDAGTRSRLNRLRQQALDRARRGRRHGWLPAAVATTAAAGVLAVALVLRPPAPLEEGPAPLEDLDLLVSQESLDMLAELEFYLWLEGELEKG